MKRIDATWIRWWAVAVAATVLAGSLGGQDAPGPAPDYGALRATAEQQYADGSYGAALQSYQAIRALLEAGTLALPEGERVWVEFRLGDCGWRAWAGRTAREGQPVEEARARLLGLLERIQPEDGARPEELWMRMQESLGESYLFAGPNPDWYSAWNHLEAALAWWGGSSDLERAREAYLGLVRRVTQPVERGLEGQEQSLQTLPTQVLDNFLRLAQTEADKAYGNYLFARSLVTRGYDPNLRLRIADAFRNALSWASAGKSPWLDDVIYAFAKWSEREGKLSFDDQGNLNAEPDYGQAVALYEMLLGEFRPGQSQYERDARRSLEEIRKPQLNVMVSQAYLPGSEVSFAVSTRNVEKVLVSLFPVSLGQSFGPGEKTPPSQEGWLEGIPVESALAWQQIELSPEPGQAFGFWNEEVPVKAIPAAGAYLVVARAGNLESRDLLLVTPTAAVLQNGADQALVWAADSLSGEPLRNATVLFWLAETTGNRGETWKWERQTGVTDGNGLVQFALSPGSQYRSLLALVAGPEGQQAVALGGYYPRANAAETWSAYAFADRSLYRPGDLVRWKAILRVSAGDRWANPPGAKARYEILDPRGEVRQKGELALNSMGAAWDEWKLPEGDAAVLGIYQLRLVLPESKLGPRVLPLFRVEEVQLPEFQVNLTPYGPQQETKTAFLVGDAVQVEVAAEYNSGGPVVGALVEAMIYEDALLRAVPLTRGGSFRRPAPGQDLAPSQPARLVGRLELRTNSEGVARISLPEPSLFNQDLEYTVEARVRDAGDREVVSSLRLRLTRQPYFVEVVPKYRLYRPGDNLEVEVLARDANDQPAAAEGRLQLLRLVWEEVWVDPRGRQITGREYQDLRTKRGWWRFGGGGGGGGYRLLRRAYRKEPVAEFNLNTGESGVARASRRVDQEGYFQLLWVGSDRNGVPIRAEADFFAADTASQEIGYQHGGLSIIVDGDRFVPGEPSPVLLLAPASQRWLLVTTGNRGLDTVRMVQMEGTVKLLNLTFDDRHVPQTHIQVTTVANNTLFQERVAVPIAPRKQQVQVEVRPDDAAYLPREISRWEILTTDAAGEPVEAEVALALTDEAAFQIQPDLAGDPLAAFFGQARPFQIQTTSSFSWKQYVDTTPDPQTGLPAVLAGSNDERGGAVAGDLVEQKFAASAAEVSSLALSTLREAGPMRAKSAPPESARGPGLAVNEALAVEDGLAAPPWTRTDFRAALFWDPAIRTNREGRAVVEIPLAESLTSWRAMARAVATDNRFGQGVELVRTRLPVIARLPLPPYVVEGDVWEVPAQVQSNAEDPIEAQVTLVGDGLRQVSGPGGIVDLDRGLLPLFPGGNGRLIWKFAADQPGVARLRLTAQTADYGDSLEKSLRVAEHGMEQVRSVSGPAGEANLQRILSLPFERRENSTRVEVSLAPTLGAILVEAATLQENDTPVTSEARMSQVLPVVLVAAAVDRTGRNRAPLSEALGLPEGVGLEEWAAEKRGEIEAMQLPGGSWPWTPGGESDPDLTAYVVLGLSLMDQAGFRGNREVLVRARRFLENRLVEAEGQVNRQAWWLHALAARHRARIPGDPSAAETEAFSNLWKQRSRLDSLSTALLALTAHYYGLTDEASLLAQNLRGGYERGTAGVLSWAPGNWPDAFSRSRTETTAAVLASLSRVDPGLLPLDSVHRWLLQGRRAAGWSFGRETAFALWGLAEYLRVQEKEVTGGQFEIWWNGELWQTVGWRSDETPLVTRRMAVLPERVLPENRLEVRRTAGNGVAYVQAVARFFSRENPIPARGDTLQIERTYEHLQPVATLLDGVVENRREVKGEETVMGSGQRVESLLRLRLAQDTAYVVVEDFLPAGLRSARLLSGNRVEAVRVSGVAGAEATPGGPPESAREFSPAPTVSAYQEVREDRLVYYFRDLPEGIWEVRAGLRAETPGRFHALPARLVAAFLPEAQGNSAEQIVVVGRE